MRLRSLVIGCGVLVFLFLANKFVANRYLKAKVPTADEVEVTRLHAELQTARAESAERERTLNDKLGELQVELAESQRLRAAREQEWFEYTRTIGMLDQDTEERRPAFLDALEEAQAGPPEPTLSPAELAAQDVRRRRVKRMLLDLNAHFAAEQIGGIDLLELGSLGEGSVGPIVARTLDDRGRPTGTLVADRLRLECSRSGFTVTLVFEEGFERRGQVEVPFGTAREEGGRRGGVKRIVLNGIDPRPWIETLPELFDESALKGTLNDARWDLRRVRLDLNRSLSELDGVGSNLRLRGLGGIQSSVLQDIQLVEIDENGAVERRLFADRMTVKTYGDGLELFLEDGVQERAGRSAAFLEGRYRIYLPHADVAAWKAARIPGLVPAALRAEEDAALGG